MRGSRKQTSTATDHHRGIIAEEGPVDLLLYEGGQKSGRQAKHPPRVISSLPETWQSVRNS